MKIYDELIYDDISIYLTYEYYEHIHRRARKGLIEYFSKEMTDEYFEELISANYIEVQSDKKISEAKLNDFKSFMVAYFFNNDNMTSETYHKSFEYIKTMDNPLERFDDLLTSSFCTDEVFLYCLDNKNMGSDESTPRNISYNNFKDKTITKFLKAIDWSWFHKAPQYVTALLVQRKLTQYQYDLIFSQFRSYTDIAFLIVEKGGYISDEKFIELLSDYDSFDISYANVGKTIKAKILENIDFIRKPEYLSVIMDFLTMDAKDFERAQIYDAILRYKFTTNHIQDKIFGDLIRRIAYDTNAIDLLKEKSDFSKYDSSTLMLIYDLNKNEYFLPSEIKEIFIF